jgi:hypothetical protein
VVLKFSSQNDEVLVLCMDVSYKRKLCTLFILYLVICIEISSTEAFHSEGSSRCAIHKTLLLRRTHHCMAQGLDPLESKTSVLDVFVHITTCNINRVHSTLLCEAHHYCPVPISWNLWAEEVGKDEGTGRHCVRGWYLIYGTRCR